MRKKEVGAFLETVLNLFITLAKLGVSRCNQMKKNYVMIKLNVLKRVILPNGRAFFARYKRIPRGELLPNIVMRRTYIQRAVPRGRRRRRRQQGQGIFDFVKKVARNLLVKLLAKKKS